MELSQVISALGVSNPPEDMRLHWEESVATFPQPRPSFLDPSEFMESRRFCGFDDTLDGPLGAVARRTANDPALTLLSWHAYRRIFDYPASPPMLSQWPDLDRSLGEPTGLFYLLIALGMVPRLRAYHRDLHLPEEVTRETAQQIRCFCGNFRRVHSGRPGILSVQVSWLRNYLHHLYFRIGRLEYWAQSYCGGAIAYRHRQTGQVVALAEEGARFNGDGFVDRDGQESVNGWTATLSADDECLTGFPISPLGYAVHRPVRLPLDRWQKVLAKGDPVLSMHIPAGGQMTPEACADSMRRAAEFFPRHFPQHLPAAFVCRSWLFNTQLEEILPSTANLVAFQRELHLYPIPSDPLEGMWFIFLQGKFDAATAPRDTALQRAILDWMARGNTWRGGGGMFILAQDVARYGTQQYRLRWPPAELA